MSDWLNIPEDIKEYQGFVYIITNTLDNKKYVGKKFFWSKVTKPPLKGKKQKRHSVKESDWKDYYGSSPNVDLSIEKYGVDVFKREILILCKTRFDCAYQEAKLQFDLGVLYDETYYNQIINCRLRKMKP